MTPISTPLSRAAGEYFGNVWVHGFRPYTFLDVGAFVFIGLLFRLYFKPSAIDTEEPSGSEEKDG